MSLLRDKAVACLAGAAVGDALGGPTEGYSTSEIRERYGGWVSGIVPSFDPDRPVNRPDAPYRKGDGRITDDTLMTHMLVRVYDAVRDHLGAYDVAEHLVPLLLSPPVWVPELAAEVPLLNRLFLAEKWLVHRLHHAHVDPREAGVGNIVNCGAAMYMAPVGVVNAGNPDSAYAEALDIAGAHQSSYGREAAGVFAAAVAAAMSPGASAQTVADATLRLAKDGTLSAIEAAIAAGEAVGHWTDGLDRIRAAIAPYDTVGDDYRNRGLGARRPSRLHSIEELPVALSLLVAADGDYEDTVLGAVNYGRDADSIAGMGGAIAAALGGLSSVPPALLDRVAEASRFDPIAPGDVLASVAIDVHAKDRARRRSHETAYDELTEDR